MLNQEVFWCTFDSAAFIEQSVLIIPYRCFHGNKVTFMFGGLSIEHVIFKDITNHQFQGRGQRGNTWVSEPGKNLTFSIIIHPAFLTTQHSFALNIITSLAICDVLAQHVYKGMAIKWPNDIYYGGKKLGGILIENSATATGRLKTSIIGIGLNINQESLFIPHATSLKLISKQDFSLSDLLGAIMDKLGQYYVQLQDQGTNMLLKIYLAKLYWIGEIRTFKDSDGLFKGRIVDVDAAGQLVIHRERSSIQSYQCKEVAFIE